MPYIQSQMDNHCHHCGTPIPGKPMPLMSDAGSNKVLVRLMCSFPCVLAIVQKFAQERCCIWCGKTTNPSPLYLEGKFYSTESYCCEACYNAAGRAMSIFEFRNDPGWGYKTFVTVSSEPGSAQRMDDFMEIRKHAPHGLYCTTCRKTWTLAECPDVAWQSPFVTFTCPSCGIEKVHQER